jgi:hypothetical protein
MAAKEISVKKYVVRLTGEERERLETLVRKGKSPARRVLKARILLKADVSEVARRRTACGVGFGRGNEIEWQAGDGRAPDCHYRGGDRTRVQTLQRTRRVVGDNA